MKTPLLESETVFDAFDRSAMEALLEAAADISLIVDGEGLIVDLAFGSEELRG